jgi:tripartite-type tricarboxylate transporter receptor subunit TctC
MRRRDFLLFGSACLAAEAWSHAGAVAQTAYPERAIKLVVPFAAGGVNDTIGRLWAQKMKPLLGPVFVENQGGGGGAVGGAAVARASPDGYTILLGSAASQVIIPAAASTTPHDAAKDLDLVSIVVVTAMAFAVTPSLPVDNLKSLVAYAKANPGKLSYGSAGAGTVPHLAGELLKSLTGAGDIVHVPYKGGAQAITDVLSGQLPMVVTSVTGQMIDLHRSGKVRLLAVTTPVRSRIAPEIPTAIEAGVPGMIAQNSYGLFVPAGTPVSVIRQISDATHAAMADQEFEQRLVATGFEPYPDSSPAAARRFIDEEIARWTPVVKALGLKPD